MNINKILESCDSISSQFSLHDWDYDFVLSREDKNEIEEYLHDIRKICENAKDEITFTTKEIEILKKNNFSIKNILYFIQDILDSEPNLSLFTSCNLNETELQDFKSKLEKLI